MNDEPSETNNPDDDQVAALNRDLNKLFYPNGREAYYLDFCQRFDLPYE